MKQAIAGVSPATEKETTVMTVWPSNAAYWPGRLLGGFYAMDAGYYIFRLGHLIALATSPIAAVIYFWRLLPWVGTRYRLTNQRLVVEKGWAHVEDKSIGLDRFDDIEVVVEPGQEWYSAGDLIFREGETERFRLDGVSRPEAFRQVCMKSRHAFVGVKEALRQQAVA